MVARCEVVMFGGLEELMSSFTILRRVTECPYIPDAVPGTEESDMI